MKKTIVLLIALMMTAAIFAGCQQAVAPAAPAAGQEAPAVEPETTAAEPEAPAAEPEAPAEEEDGKSIYFLNYKPETAKVYDAIAAAYFEETGVTVKVETAAGGTYQAVLADELAKTDAPTIFQLNGPVGYGKWSDHCLDIKDTELYGMLSDKSLAVTDGDGVYGVPYAVEGYGIIYNREILEEYMSNDFAVVKSVAEINNFATFKAVVENMQAHKADLAIEGVFASTSMSDGEQWRWHTHLLSLPFYYEFRELGDDTVAAGRQQPAVKFAYGDNFKNIFDLYIGNSCTEPFLLGTKTVDDAMTEFALGKAAMVQNGSWSTEKILGVEGNTVAAENIRFLPIYTGIAGDEKQGLCIGTENFFAVNSQVSKAKQKASVDFLVWLFSSETGKAFVKNDLRFIAPFTTFADDEKPADPLAAEVLAWRDKEGTVSVPWTFGCFPGEDFKNRVGAELLKYCRGGSTWDDVTAAVTGAWEQQWPQNH